MKENELVISARGHDRQESKIEDKSANPLYGAIAWAGISAGTILMVLTLPRHESQSVYQDENSEFSPRAERMTGDSPDKLLSQMVEEEDPAKFLARTKLNIVPQAVQTTEEVQRPSEGASSEIVSGKATYYGVDDGYGLQNTLGCTGEPFDPYDPKTAARPEDSPFVCGDEIEVCDVDSCIDVEIKDTCPGCDENGIVIDLSYGAMGALTGYHGTAMVTIRKK